MRSEITTPEVISEESAVELSLRPQRLAEFIGQPKVKDSLRIAIDAALGRRDPLDHTLFHGTPRVANRLLRRVRDFAQVRAQGVITKQVAEEALLMLDVDEYGLDEMDARILKALIEHFEGGVGLNTVAVAVGEDSGTLEEVYEPFLIQNGFLMRTPRGRMATSRAFKRFGYAVPASRAGDPQPQASLFEG